MANIWAITKRELLAYFGTPIAYVFLIIFVAMTGIFAFFVGRFFARGEADLQPFFDYHPWLYLLLVPAISMRLWAEERRSGTIELLITQPVSIWEAVAGKFLAGWIFLGIALILTFPMWITVNVLGEPDNGVILASYIASFFMAGAFLAVGACLSATTKNQVIAFVLTAVVCFLFNMSGTPMVLGALQSWAPEVLVNAVSGLSFLDRFGTVTKGIIDIRDTIFFISFIAFWLFANTLVVEMKKAD